MSVLEANQGKPVRTDSCFQSATLSQFTSMVIEDLCRVIESVHWAPFQCVPVVWQMCSSQGNSKVLVLYYQVY